MTLQSSSEVRERERERERGEGQLRWLVMMWSVVIVVHQHGGFVLLSGHSISATWRFGTERTCPAF